MEDISEGEGIKRSMMGTGYAVVPTPDNPIVQLLSEHGVPASRIIGLRYTGDAFQALNTNKYNDYIVVFFGVSSDENLPTRIFFENKDGTSIFCWQVQISWRDSDVNSGAYIEAVWSEAEHDYVVSIQMGYLDTLDKEAGKHLAEGLSLLLLIKDRLRRHGDTRPYDPWEGRLPEYKAAVDDWYDLVNYIRKFSIEKKHDNWAGMVKESREYKRLSEGRDERWLELAIKLIAYRTGQYSEAKKSRNKAKQRKCRIGLGALGVTCDIATIILEPPILKPNLTNYDTETSIDYYRVAGGKKGSRKPSSKRD